jgi:hypothetical protein
MREKKLYKLITFHTTTEAMAMERFCTAHQIPGRLIPIPREISAGCGLSYRLLPEDAPALSPYLKSDNTMTDGQISMTFESIVEIML